MSVRQIFECRLCLKQFRTNRQYERHWSDKHIDREQSEMFVNGKQCIYCCRYFISKQSLNSHFGSCVKREEFVKNSGVINITPCSNPLNRFVDMTPGIANLQLTYVCQTFYKSNIGGSNQSYGYPSQLKADDDDVKILCEKGRLVKSVPPTPPVFSAIGPTLPSVFSAVESVPPQIHSGFPFQEHETTGTFLILTCIRCRKSVGNVNDLREHVRMFHPFDFCNECSSFGSSFQLVQHLKCAHGLRVDVSQISSSPAVGAINRRSNESCVGSIKRYYEPRVTSNGALDSTYQLKCILCPELTFFRDITQFRLHCVKQHKYPCDSRSFYKLFTCIPKSTVLPANEFEMNVGNFHCKSCSAVYSDEEKLKLHIGLKHDSALQQMNAIDFMSV